MIILITAPKTLWEFEVTCETMVVSSVLWMLAGALLAVIGMARPAVRITIVIVIAVLFISYLQYIWERRIARLEKVIDELAPLKMVKMVERLGKAAFRPAKQDELAVCDRNDAHNVLDKIGYRIFKGTLALVEYGVFSMGVLRDFLREKGVTDGDLRGLEEQLAPNVFWPASSILSRNG